MSQTVTRTDRLKAAHEKLQEAVASIVTGEDWQRMLQTAAKFHRYSFQNQLLIFCQRPDATVVAGFNKWKSLGRFVEKGEKGIAIFAPCKYKVDPSSDGPSAASSDGKGKDQEVSASAVEVAAPSAQRGDRPKTEGHPSSNGPSAASPGGKDKIEGASASAVEVAAPSAQRGDRPKTEVLRGFRIVHVFDISQTEGEDLPDLHAVRPKLLDGDAPEGIWDALVVQAKTAGFEVIRDRKRSENGYCDLLKKEIAVRPDVAPAQAVKTLVHELAHALLHGDTVVREREIEEVEVESVAYIVCDALGLDTSDYSFSYVARWSSGDVERIIETGEGVVGCAKAILDAVSVGSFEAVEDT